MFSTYKKEAQKDASATENKNIGKKWILLEKTKMNKHINAKFLMAAIVKLFIFSAFNSTFAQKGIGKQYNSRDPLTCADATSPKSGALSAAKAVEYVTCENEGINGDQLYFVEDVKVQVGAGRRYNPAEDINFSGIDTKFLIYPIRGSYKGYQCAAISPDKTNTNRNCTLRDYPKAVGACYKKAGFGEWRCMLVDINGEVVKSDIPPPGAAKQNANADAKTTTKKDDQNANTETADKDANGFPKPDFSEMEDWFEIVRYEYPKPPDRNLMIYFKSKTDGSKPLIFYVEFRDKDGILVQSADASPMCCSDALMMTAKGEPNKVRVQIPSESIMKQVTSVKVVRAK